MDIALTMFLNKKFSYWINSSINSALSDHNRMLSFELPNVYICPFFNHSNAREWRVCIFRCSFSCLDSRLVQSKFITRSQIRREQSETAERRVCVWFFHNSKKARAFSQIQFQCAHSLARARAGWQAGGWITAERSSTGHTAAIHFRTLIHTSDCAQ